MQTTKYIIAGTAIAAAIMGAALSVSADTTGTTGGSGSVTVRPPNHNPAMMLNVNASGHVLLRGTIDSVGTGSLTVKSWGGDWTVNTASSTKLMPNDMTQFKTGDFVGVQGTIDQTAGWTVNATLVRDWTQKVAMSQESQQNKQEVNSMRPRVYVGTASNVTATSLTLTASNGTAYTVTIEANAKILNKKWLTLSASDIANGDTVRVYGVNASGTITAEVVRDISIPARNSTISQQLQGAPRH